MNRDGRAVLILSIGLITGRLIWSGGYGWFVQQRMFIPLVLATIVLIGFGGYEALSGLRKGEAAEDATKRAVAPSVGWLLLLPLIVLMAVAPTGLGAAAANRVEAFTPTEQTSRFAPLAASGEPIEMRVYDFLDRAIWDDAESLDGVPVRLEGLVVNDERVTDGFMLTRFMVSCCAADGIPLQVAVRGVDQVLDDNTWVVADVVWVPPEIPYEDTDSAIVVEAEAVSIEPQPEARNDPYESPY